MYEQEAISFQISGFYQLTGAKFPIGKNIEGITKSEIVLTKAKIMLDKVFRKKS